MTNWDTLRDEVTESGDVLTVDMLRLREVHQVSKLGSTVRKNISDKLHGAGLGHYPQSLPQYQEQEVRLYRLGTPIADLVAAVIAPGSDNDEKLKAATGNGANADEILDRIRELVEE